MLLNKSLFSVSLFFLPGLKWETPQRKPADGVPAEERLFSVRKGFVKRVSEPVLNQVLDELFSHRIISDEEMQNFRRQGRVLADRARDVIDTVRGKGNAACSVLIAALCEVDPLLSRELNLS